MYDINRIRFSLFYLVRYSCRNQDLLSFLELMVLKSSNVMRLERVPITGDMRPHYSDPLPHGGEYLIYPAWEENVG
jgi:hypothetical protein